MAAGQRFLGAVLAAGFLLGIHEGRVALWQGEDPMPIYVSDYSADTLPETDRQALKAGISLPDRASASAGLEDYAS